MTIEEAIFASQNFFEYSLISKESQFNITTEEKQIYTVLVTGGTGFIGSHTIDQLLSAGYHIKCLVRPQQTNLRWLQDVPIDLVKCDLLDINSILKCIRDVDYIIHIAGITKAKYKSEFFIGNVKTTQNLLTAASQMKHLKKLCFISSLSAVGPSATGVPLTESAHCHPITTYGESKLEAEHLCKRYMNRIPIVIIRPPAVFGPRDTDIYEMFKWVNHGFRPVIGSSEKTLSLIYAPDLARGIIQATFDERTSGEIYNIADPTIFTFSSIIDYIATFVHSRTIRIYLPKGLVYSIAGITQFTSAFSKKPAILNIEKARDLLQKHWVCDPTKIQKHIGFQSKTSIYDGIKKTFHWYRETGWL
jgi:nucleoside-diphosphate-sugar epimerase